MSETSEQWTERIVSCLPVKPYYAEDGIIIIKSDCREILPYLPKVDLVLTDPPYGVEFEGKNTKHTRRKGAGYSMFEDSAEYVRSVAVAVVRECVSKYNRVVVTPGSKNCFLYDPPAAMGAIFYPSGAGMCEWGFTCSQPIFYYGKCPYLANSMGARPNSFSSTEAAEASEHPCPKPIGTMKWLVNRASLEGETILDPFMGSGTTLVAAKQLGRKAIGIEIEEKYVKIAIERLSQKVFSFEEPRATLPDGGNHGLF